MLTNGKNRERVLVTGAAGFIGHHLVGYLKDRGYWVRGADRREPEFEPSRADEFLVLDLRGMDAAATASDGVTHVYALAAEMGGIGFIEREQAMIMRDSVLIDTSSLEAARQNGVTRYLYTSSACVYPRHRQLTTDAQPLKEDEAYPADAEGGYGWEKLFGEQLCAHFRADFGLETRVARLHNVYGPLGAWQGGREKSPAALCRKVAMASDGDEIEIWGDGAQRRSYCFIDDCVEGLHRLMLSDHAAPLNIGQTRGVSINELVDLLAGIAGKRVSRRHLLDAPQGVRGRSSDNTLVRATLGWEPLITLEEGMTRTYRWISEMVERAGTMRS
ncbi:MAG: NAD-dependent epimerase/dehydratase family protein [Gemmatimonadaceae bacterium]|nr:NAD-dependent epimerase/dehydratase family protein [Gemmatimonadaceae bacterium]